MKHAIFVTGGNTHMPNIEGMLNDRGYNVCWLNHEETVEWQQCDNAKADVAIVSLNAMAMAENPFALVNQLRRQWPEVPVLFMLGAQAYGKKPAVQNQIGVYCVTEPVDLPLLCKFLDLLIAYNKDGQPVMN